MIMALNNRSIREEFDRIDEILSFIINIVRCNIEDPNRTVLFSMKKLVSRTKVLFWKVVKSKVQRKSIDNNLMIRRQEFLGLN